MEIVLEFDDVVRLVREGLEAKGMAVPEDAEIVVRRNNKRGTLRIVFKVEEPGGRRPAR